jgi:hypothetical protein
VLAGGNVRGITYFSSIVFFDDLVHRMVARYSVSDVHSDAFAKFASMPLVATEEVIGVLGLYVWAKLDELIDGVVPFGEIDPKT